MAKAGKGVRTRQYNPLSKTRTRYEEIAEKYLVAIEKQIGKKNLVLKAPIQRRDARSKKYDIEFHAKLEGDKVTLRLPAVESPTLLFDFLHECAHVLLRHLWQDDKPDSIKESEAVAWAAQTMKQEGVPIPEKAMREQTRYAASYRNPSSGAINLAQYVQAAVDHVRGAHDAAGEIIHNTPKAKRREFAREIWFRRGYRGKNPAQRSLAKKIDAIMPASRSAHEADFFADLEERLLGKQSSIYGAHATRKPSFIAKNKRNPSEADILYKKFHGRGPDKITTMLVAGVDPYGGHPELTSLGPLIRLVVGEGAEMDEDGTVKDEGDWVNEICFVPIAEYKRKIERLNTKDQAQVREFKAWLKASGAPDVAAVPNTRQLYFVGGKQFLDDAMLKSLGSDPEKDLADLGFCFQIEYVAQKRFDKFEVMTYYHAFGEVTHVQPRVIYRKPQKMLELVGGEYEVKSIGIDN